MYDPMLAKSFSRKERKRFGYCAFVVIVTLVASSCMISKPQLHPLSMISEVMNLQLSIASAQELRVVNSSTFSQPLESKAKVVTKPIMCNVSGTRSDYCEMRGDIRILGNSSTIFIVTHHHHHPNTNTSSSWIIQPYPRKDSVGAMSRVKKWTVKQVEAETENVPKCETYHAFPGVLFSLGGYSGNHFHDFTDLLVPIYATARCFNGDAHLLATNHKKWWVGKYRAVLDRLSRHRVIDIDNEAAVQCFPSITLGLKSPNNKEELSIDSSFPSGMKHFKEFLRSTFSLERRSIEMRRTRRRRRPRLMIVSRRKSRVLTNEGEVAEMAEELGYEVVRGVEASLSTNLSRFAEAVNSCDVLLGVHGAGLTNMVFLPDKAVVIQVIPLGEMDGIARRDFGEPCKGLGLSYLEYKIGVKESNLVDTYPLDHVVFKDPKSFHRRGWTAFGSIYLDKQNVSIDVQRFRPTLIHALRLLQH